jgi:hypothetical protein
VRIYARREARAGHLTGTEDADDRECLAHCPFVVVQIGCRVCSRRGSYRLARLAAKFGPEISLRDLTDRFSYDCLWRAEARSKKGKSACGVYLIGSANFSRSGETRQDNDLVALRGAAVCAGFDAKFSRAWTRS